jgi:hypothetical protein
MRLTALQELAGDSNPQPAGYKVRIVTGCWRVLSWQLTSDWPSSKALLWEGAPGGMTVRMTTSASYGGFKRVIHRRGPARSAG